MRDSLKVAGWEIRKMLRNKSFLISILLTPVIMVVFGALPTLLAKFETDRSIRLYVIDEIGVFDTLLSSTANQNVVLEKYDGDVASLESQVLGKSNEGFLVLTPDIYETRTVVINMGGDGVPNIDDFNRNLELTLLRSLLERHGFDSEAIVAATTGFVTHTVSMTQKGDILVMIIPAIFGGLIIMAVFITGMMTMQSAIVEKKDRMAEILLSSISPYSMMQGKILGCFVLGMFQVLSWLFFGIIAAYSILKIPVMRYLFVPQMPIVLFFALAGYLLYSSILVSFGATIEDMTTATNFQSMVTMIPMLPIFFIAPVIVNPNGVIAKVGSYFPLTTPGVMLLRLTLSTTMTVIDILLPALLLIFTVWLMMRLAGKIFKTGILMYGKNATPKEIWRWMKM
ncbi:MAG: Uncharacterized protein FD169_659 [Bacillota bacterium]|nr:MAG: Uncharacterized protein FD169_659 [Bacillota bacterium]MBS3950669.1 ABC transporter permease [Peptococcaceae bacterium]